MGIIVRIVAYPVVVGSIVAFVSSAWPNKTTFE